MHHVNEPPKHPIQYPLPYSPPHFSSINFSAFLPSSLLFLAFLGGLQGFGSFFALCFGGSVTCNPILPGQGGGGQRRREGEDCKPVLLRPAIDALGTGADHPLGIGQNDPPLVFPRRQFVDDPLLEHDLSQSRLQPVNQPQVGGTMPPQRYSDEVLVGPGRCVLVRGSTRQPGDVFPLDSLADWLGVPISPHFAPFRIHFAFRTG